MSHVWDIPKLRFIKTYFQSSMTQDRLNSLAILLKENDLVTEIGVEIVMKRFAELKPRKKRFM